MIICNQCGKENQDRFRFCLGCGTVLTPSPISSSSAPHALQKIKIKDDGRSVSIVSRPIDDSGPAFVPDGLPSLLDDASHSHRDPIAFKKYTSDSAPFVVENSETEDSADCSQCGAKNPREFVFCGHCGKRVQKAPQRSGAASQTNTTPQPHPAPRGNLVLIKPDGNMGGTFPISAKETHIGRESGQLFFKDRFLSPRHAMFEFEDNNLFIEDADSLNGIFIKITQPERLLDGDMIRIGQELLAFRAVASETFDENGTEYMGSPNPGYWGKISVVTTPDSIGMTFPLLAEDVVVGRERGDIMFPDDGYVSSTHAKLSLRRDGTFLSDLGSSNGTFIRIKKRRNIPTGTFILLGQQLFRVEYR